MSRDGAGAPLSVSTRDGLEVNVVCLLISVCRDLMSDLNKIEVAQRSFRNVRNPMRHQKSRSAIEDISSFDFSQAAQGFMLAKWPAPRSIGVKFPFGVKLYSVCVVIRNISFQNKARFCRFVSCR